MFYHRFKSSSRFAFACGMAAYGLAIAPLPTFAQTLDPQTPEPTTVCAFDPSSGAINPLGMRAFITVSEVEGNSVFLFEQFPSFVSSGVSSGQAGGPPIDVDIASERTLTIYETPIAEARQLVVNNPPYYAALIGLEDIDQVMGENGFGPVNDTLTCQTAGGTATNPMPAGPTLADLPDGNYRMTTAEYPNRIVSDEELLASGGYLFVFQKAGNSVTGNFGHIDHEEGACITGTVSGNTITGQAYTDDRPTTIEGQTYLDPGGHLLLGEKATNVRYDGSVMNVTGLSRINAGTRLPVTDCLTAF
ncbi:hypothetical protein [Leptolyngbya sp. BC1307]|uniref:hypothetical protein n=1 Tax=Leptolyngbya sp. BC1307 TaxID=2029589 RepID=UPI00114104EC|nr:hypothetical protein [Leptolyngbya sp. BC1307]